MSEKIVCHTLLCKLIEEEQKGIRQSKMVQAFYFIFGAVIILFSVLSYVKPAMFGIDGKGLMQQITTAFGLLVTGLGIYSNQTISSRKQRVIKLEVRAEIFASPSEEELQKRKQECEDMINSITL